MKRNETGPAPKAGTKFHDAYVTWVTKNGTKKEASETFSTLRDAKSWVEGKIQRSKLIQGGGVHSYVWVKMDPYEWDGQVVGDELEEVDTSSYKATKTPSGTVKWTVPKFDSVPNWMVTIYN